MQPPKLSDSLPECGVDYLPRDALFFFLEVHQEEGICHISIDNQSASSLSYHISLFNLYWNVIGSFKKQSTQSERDIL